ncbi:hypothetical protein lpari_01645 [Legionella parisiensis]|uniref:Uncharacterized protein n=1 Tax=Legionella parisiensis TaxID=45071 RepID=A0A1E5JS38_9GAMM|nr:hypothetical protein lpari_01645 [Legionella parisiensis]STX72163.1 Uncharacterised protein [Legionella parisiensis]
MAQEKSGCPFRDVITRTSSHLSKTDEPQEIKSLLV